MMTRDQMKAIHDKGESVVHKGRVYPPGSTLPTDSEIAESAPEQAGESLKALRASRKALSQEIERLEAIEEKARQKAAQAAETAPEEEPSREPKQQAPAKKDADHAADKGRGGK
jgi:hypothetical protein